ncbi:MAG TPA: rod shape-determining protein MreD [Firmicutes bacterium]|nr:rod shape-determining protein MreD [Bacillota bacterium]
MRLPGLLLRAAVLVIAVALESSIMPYLAPPGVRVDLVLILTVLTALHQGRPGGAVWGFGGGLLEDLVTGRVVGVSALGKMTAGYLVGAVREVVFRDSLLVPVVLVAFGGTVNGLITLALASSFGIMGTGPAGFIRAEIVSVTLSAILTPLVHMCPIFPHARGVSDVREKA